MIQPRRLAAVLVAAALLAAPMQAAGKSSSKSDSPLSSAWAWLYDVFCEDNGYIVP